MEADLIAFAACALAILAYFVFLSYRVSHNPNYTFKATMAHSKEAWVRSIMAERRDILAVQTLRNSTMAATFMASTAVLLIVGVLTLSAQGDRLEASWHALGLTQHGGGPEMWLMKTLAMLIDLFASFLAFTMSIRQFHHIGYMINVPLSGKFGRVPPELVVAQMDRANRFYWFGMRTYFLLVPLLLWLFGSYLMIAATAVLILVMFRLDHMPPEEEGIAQAAEVLAPER
ncbi:MAG: DUF599 domain-containing protein [Beijerinckiaceae bacterium]